LDEVAAAYGPSAVVALEREALGVKSVLAPRAPQSSWEHYTLGRALLASGDVPRATQQLSAALALDPAGHWPNFYYGLCAYRAGRYEDAVAAYSVCIGSAPDVAGCFYNRALAFAALGRATSALNDYDRALQLDPTHAASALNRGMLHFQHGRLEQATADLRTALSHGADAATVHYDLALVHASGQNPTRAMEHVRLALESNPAHEPSRQLRDSLRQKLVRQ
jgi:tetratricopeptide (TPR) repeat protein